MRRLAIDYSSAAPWQRSILISRRPGRPCGTTSSIAFTPEYEFMPEKLVNDKHEFTFAAGDRIVAFAEAHKMPVLGHMLLWHFVTRKWLFEDAAGKSLSREKALANLKMYIDGVVGHYKGRIKAWDVVNEAISDKDGEYLRPTPTSPKSDRRRLCLRSAFGSHADPKAKTYWNDCIEQ